MIDIPTSQFLKEVPGIDRRLSFTLVLPRGDIDQFVIFCHGFCGNKDENGLFKKLAKRYAKKKIGSIRYDWTGINDSEGEFVETDLHTHADDLEKIINWIHNEMYPTTKLIGLGFSLGATLFLLVDSPLISKYIFLSPAISPKKDMWPRYDTETIRDQIHKNGYFDKNGLKVSERFLYDLKTTDARAIFEKRSHSIMVIHSRADPRIDCENVKSYINEMVKKPQFHLFDKASHSFKPHKEYVPKVFQFSNSYCHDEIAPFNDDMSPIPPDEITIIERRI